MNKTKQILIKLEKDLYEEYKNVCRIHGFNMSQRIRNFISEEVGKFKNKK